MIYKNLTNQKWFLFSEDQQMGNIGAEVLRVLNRISEGDSSLASSSLDRVLELIDLTLNDPKWRGREKELLLLREVICAKVHAPEEYLVTKEQLMDYLTPFAIISRSHK